MADERRKLAAILVADVVGYSKLMGSDEAGTVARLKALLADVIEPAIARHSGRLFKAVGDGFLVEFASAVQAVTAAQSIQHANAGGTMPLRIGIHVGDVIVQGDDLMGDGVNIAARIEGVAEAGGIAISRQVYDQVRDKLDVGFADKGEVPLKNLARPVHVFAIGSDKSAIAPASAHLTLPDKPSIAVLPFQNMSGDPEQEYFADGMVEDITTALSRFKSLFVTARNSAFSYKGKAVDIKQVGRELGVRYVLEGSVRKAGARLRITGQLIDSETGAHLWADRFDGALEDVFALQDEVTEKVIAAIAPGVVQAEMKRALRKPTASLGAHDCVLRASALWWRGNRDASNEALVLLKRALEIDPGHSSALGMLLAAYGTRRTSGFVTDLAAEMAEVERLIPQAVRLGQDDAVALTLTAWAIAFARRDIDSAGGHIRRALMLNPNLASAWLYRGWIHLWSGNAAEAVDDFAHATRLDPLNESGEWLSGKAHLNFFLGRHEDALRLAEGMVQRAPEGHSGLRIGSASAAFAGKLDVARKLGARLLQTDPAFRLSRLEEYLGPYRSVEYLEKYREGLRRAGLPE